VYLNGVGSTLNERCRYGRSQSGFNAYFLFMLGARVDRRVCVGGPLARHMVAIVHLEHE